MKAPMLLTLLLGTACGDKAETEPVVTEEADTDTDTDTDTDADSDTDADADTDTDTDADTDADTDTDTDADLYAHDAFELAHAWTIGTAENVRVGDYVDAGGDSNGDGRPELLAFAHGTESYAQYLYQSPWEAGEFEADTANGLEASSAWFAGDLNNDGYDDVIAGGNALHGPFSGFVDSDDGVNYSWVMLTGHVEQDSDIGDFNGDGLDDILTGNSGHELGGCKDPEGPECAGLATVFIGPLSSTPEAPWAAFYGPDDAAGAGDGLAGAGDTNGDGFAEILIWAEGPTYFYGTGRPEERWYLVNGPTSGTHSLAEADATFVMEQEADMAAPAVTPLGDLDGDGNADIALAGTTSYFDGARGQVQIMLGPITGTTTVSDADFVINNTDDSSYIGVTIESLDANGDGEPDVVISRGWTWDTPDKSELLVIFGPLRENMGPEDFDVKIATEEGTWDSDSFGRYGLVNAGDTDGDGTEDLWVGAPLDDINGYRTGTLYLFLGSDLTAAAAE